MDKFADRAEQLEKALDAMDVETFREFSRSLVSEEAPVLALLSSEPEPEQA